jgi:formate hydrogenlyase transcriptional activator
MNDMARDKSALYRALFELSQSISGHEDLEGMCHALSEALRRVVSFDIMALLLFNEASDAFHMYGLTLSNEPAHKSVPRVVPGKDHVAGWVWTTQRPLFIPRLDQETRWHELLEPARSFGLSSFLLVPLTTGDHRLGVLALGFFSPSEESPDAMSFIHRVASEFAVTIDSYLSRQKYLRERDRLQLLFDVTNALVSKLSRDELFSEISEQLHKVVAYDIVALTLLDNKTGELLLIGFQGEDNLRQESDRTRGNPEGMPSAEALRTGRPVRTDEVDFERFPSPHYKRLVDAGFRSSCSIPLISPNATLGTLELARTSGQRFSDDDVDLLVQVARQVAIAIENSLAYRELAEIKERLAIEKLYLEDEIRVDQNFGEMLGKSRTFQTVLRNIQIVGPTEATVLILGETGTGKELAARAIHEQSGRKSNSFIKINCAAIPSSLLESELFGHERGAFTGALTQRIGRFELAHEGTLFLDEIGEIPVELQSKLLRAIQEQEFERLGGNRTLRVNVRFVAASNRDLKAMVDAGSFRSDLYYRLHVFPLMLPPLRDRREDIPLLARYFVQKYAQRIGRKIESIPSAAMDILTEYNWPGNIRELQNVLERSVILSRSRTLELAMPETAAVAREAARPAGKGGLDERERILQALKESKGLVSGPKGAAERLGMKRTTLQAHMKRLGITRNYQ